ncbi:hypothetical protein OZD68_00485 [Wolbachia endosymbiont of Drosophila bicornuta]|uniref:hypothetical protein n=1 Tax=Wolbachia TaxID=953 RepID=UPI0015FB7D49|nr:MULTISPECIES: hypothetical protein [Wolbachia]MBA8754667.1 hypothetical protein [Wolbachia pipientis]MDE5056101.1 hypothetical protein [Wolbachia endosymbiont of Drosophila bicornuta]
MLLLYHSHKHISYPIRTIARSAIIIQSTKDSPSLYGKVNIILCSSAWLITSSSLPFNSSISSSHRPTSCELLRILSISCQIFSYFSLSALFSSIWAKKKNLFFLLCLCFHHENLDDCSVHHNLYHNDQHYHHHHKRQVKEIKV